MASLGCDGSAATTATTATTATEATPSAPAAAPAVAANPEPAAAEEAAAAAAPEPTEEVEVVPDIIQGLGGKDAMAWTDYVAIQTIDDCLDKAAGGEEKDATRDQLASCMPPEKFSIKIPHPHILKDDCWCFACPGEKLRTGCSRIGKTKAAADASMKCDPIGAGVAERHHGKC